MCSMVILFITVQCSVQVSSNGAAPSGQDAQTVATAQDPQQQQQQQQPNAWQVIKGVLFR